MPFEYHNLEFMLKPADIMNWTESWQNNYAFEFFDYIFQVVSPQTSNHSALETSEKNECPFIFSAGKRL